MKTESDAKASILTFLQFSLLKTLHSGAYKGDLLPSSADPLSALHRNLRPEGGATKEAVGRQPARDAPTAILFSPTGHIPN